MTNIMMEAEGSEQVFPAKKKAEHYIVISEPGMNYLFQFVPEKATKEESHTENIAKAMFGWLRERGLDKSLMAVGGDYECKHRCKC